MNKYKLTGKFYHRKTILGMVLYVEVSQQKTGGTPNGRITINDKYYKKASEQDASDLIRWFQMLVGEFDKTNKV